MNGVVFQMSTISTAYIAVSTLAVQAIFCVISPRLSSMSLTMPNWSLNSHAQSLAETMVGIAQGIRIAARTRPRPLNSAFRTSATISPSTVSIETEMIAKRKVL